MMERSRMSRRIREENPRLQVLPEQASEGRFGAAPQGAGSLARYFRRFQVPLEIKVVPRAFALMGECYLF